MFFDSTAWPPPPDGFDPPPPAPRLNAKQERIMLRIIGVFLVLLFLEPFAGSSVTNAAVAVVHSTFTVPR